MKRLLLIVLPLLLIVGCSEVEGQQQLIQVVKTYKYGDVRSITFYKETRNRIGKVKYVEYYDNGRKRREENYNDDGRLDGPLTYWDTNGQKSLEKTYKDGDVISEKRWNEDGSVEE